MMRQKARGVSFALMMATTLHAIATGNLLPASVQTVCVDSDAYTVIKLIDRGTHQAYGLVTDCEFFLSEPEENLSTNTYYGDGSPIEPEAIDELRRAYQAESRSFPWQVGDVLLIDNMLASHGRQPYSGPRKVAVVMADPHSPETRS